MKKQLVFKLSAIILALSLLFSLSLSALAADDGSAGVTFVSDWGQKATSKNAVALDGLSVTFSNPALSEGYCMLGFGLSKSADGIGLGGSGDGVMFRMMYAYGSGYADVMPMNIANWWDTNAPADTAWVHNGYLGAGVWPSYTFTVKKNGGNYDFKVNDIAIASVPVAEVETLAGTNPYISFYMWNNAGNSVTISDISGVAPKAKDFTMSGSMMTTIVAPSNGSYIGVNGAKASGGVNFVSDWGQKATSKEPVALDGLSVTFDSPALSDNFSMLGFGLSKNADGIGLGGSGEGVMFRMMYAFGTGYADAMPMNIANWWDTNAPADTAWVHNGYLGAGVWPSYTFTVNKNGDNYDFAVNSIAIASVPAADVEALAGTNPYITFYMWNNAGNSSNISEVSGIAPKAADYNMTGASMTDLGTVISADWMQRVKYSEKIYVDGLSVKIANPSMPDWGMIGFGLAKDEAGVDLGSSGDGILFKMMYAGTSYADVMPMNIGNWWDTNAPEGTAWIHNGYLGPGLWSDYTFTINKNGDNYDFAVNGIAVASVPAADVEALINEDGSAYMSFYAWNGLNTYSVAEIINGAALENPAPELPYVNGGSSVSEEVSGLGVKFDLTIEGMAVQEHTYNVADFTNATFGGYKLLGVGVIASNGVATADIKGVYMYALDGNTASFAFRVINIPKDSLDVEITMTPYFVVEIDGVETILYGEDVVGSYNSVLNG